MAETESLADDAVAVRTVEHDGDTARSDSDNNTSLSVGLLMRHTLTDRRITLNIDVLTNLEDVEDACDGRDTVLSVMLSKKVACACLCSP